MQNITALKLHFHSDVDYLRVTTIMASSKELFKRTVATLGSDKRFKKISKEF